MAAMADLIAPVRALVFGAESLAALQDGIIDLYADSDPAELGQVMAQALLAAELAGRFEAVQDDHPALPYRDVGGRAASGTKAEAGTPPGEGND